MKVSFPVLLSSQVAIKNRLDSVAHNVANSRTVGFRAEGTRFESILTEAADKTVAYSSKGKTYISRQSGSMFKTGNMLDVAVQGEAWMALRGPAGTIYTRDGRMRILPTGNLQSITGYPVLDVSGSPLSLNAEDGPVKIAHDGMISQAGRQIGAIGLFTIPETAKLTRAENSGVTADREAIPVVEFTTNGVVQGSIEQANVNPMLELARLIEVTRAFESLKSMSEQLEKTSTDAIRTLGSAS